MKTKRRTTRNRRKTVELEPKGPPWNGTKKQAAAWQQSRDFKNAIAAHTGPLEGRIYDLENLLRVANTQLAGEVEQRVSADKIAMRALRNDLNPVPMLLTCPACSARHIDEGRTDENATKSHHTHACQKCGMVWRPALTFTFGVQFLPGFKDPERATGMSLAVGDVVQIRGDANDPDDWQRAEVTISHGTWFGCRVSIEWRNVECNVGDEGRTWRRV